MRRCKRALVGPAFTQDPKGWWESSGSLGSKTSKTRRNTEEEKQRWVEMGRMAGRQMAEEFLKRTESTSLNEG